MRGAINTLVYFLADNRNVIITGILIWWQTESQLRMRLTSCAGVRRARSMASTRTRTQLTDIHTRCATLDLISLVIGSVVGPWCGRDGCDSVVTSARIVLDKSPRINHRRQVNKKTVSSIVLLK